MVNKTSVFEWTIMCARLKDVASFVWMVELNLEWNGRDVCLLPVMGEMRLTVWFWLYVCVRCNGYWLTRKFRLEDRTIEQQKGGRVGEKKRRRKNEKMHGWWRTEESEFENESELCLHCKCVLTITIDYDAMPYRPCCRVLYSCVHVLPSLCTNSMTWKWCFCHHKWTGLWTWTAVHCGVFRGMKGLLAKTNKLTPCFLSTRTLFLTWILWTFNEARTSEWSTDEERLRKNLCREHNKKKGRIGEQKGEPLKGFGLFFCSFLFSPSTGSLENERLELKVVYRDIDFMRTLAEGTSHCCWRRRHRLIHHVITRTTLFWRTDLTLKKTVIKVFLLKG